MGKRTSTLGILRSSKVKRLGRRMLDRWPLFAVALGGIVLQRLLARRRLRRLTAEVAEPWKASPTQDYAPQVAWSPTGLSPS